MTAAGNGLEPGSEWEAAYLRFETPAQEIRKFRRRLLHMGAANWSRDLQIVELCCGRGNGLRALQSLGFHNVSGVDLSPALAAHVRGPANVVVGDCRHLPFKDSSCDLVVVHGGLHHLNKLPADLDRTLLEAARVLRSGGHFMAVEPWLTPFLKCVHSICETRIARVASAKIDALATMIEHERNTYFSWLNSPDTIRLAIARHFLTEQCSIGWGKFSFLGRKP